MLTTRVTFEVCPASASTTFDCPECGKPNRKRTFRAECTVNPFNKGPDGFPLNRSEVFRQSAAKAEKERDEFMNAPLCKSCEDEKSYTEMKSIRASRRGEVVA